MPAEAADVPSAPAGEEMVDVLGAGGPERAAEEAPAPPNQAPHEAPEEGAGRGPPDHVTEPEPLDDTTEAKIPFAQRRQGGERGAAVDVGGG